MNAFTKIQSTFMRETFIYRHNNMGNISLCLLLCLALMLVPINGRWFDPDVHQRAQRNVGPGTNLRLLSLDCSPPLSGHSGYNGYQSLPRPGNSRCHVWVDQSGNCRINFSHTISRRYCQRVIGIGNYNSLPNYGPNEPGAPDWDGGPPEGK